MRAPPRSPAPPRAAAPTSSRSTARPTGPDAPTTATLMALRRERTLPRGELTLASAWLSSGDTSSQQATGAVVPDQPISPGTPDPDDEQRDQRGDHGDEPEQPDKPEQGSG